MTPERLPLSLSDATGVPYYRQIVDQVAQLIRSGQLKPDAMLPSVRDLAKDLLVSLITVRRSYADLEGAGLIVRRQGSGTFVAKEVTMASKDKAAAEIMEGFERIILQSRQMGLDGKKIRAIFEQALAGEEQNDGRQ
jgi:GntR family transcriptional regulator